MRDLLKPRARPIAAFALVVVTLLGGLLVLAAQKGETQGGKKPEEEMRPASLRVSYQSEISASSKGAGGDKAWSNDSLYRQTMDTTIHLEVPEYLMSEAHCDELDATIRRLRKECGPAVVHVPGAPCANIEKLERTARECRQNTPRFRLASGWLFLENLFKNLPKDLPRDVLENLPKDLAKDVPTTMRLISVGGQVSRFEELKDWEKGRKFCGGGREAPEQPYEITRVETWRGSDAFKLGPEGGSFDVAVHGDKVTALSVESHEFSLVGQSHETETGCRGYSRSNPRGPRSQRILAFLSAFEVPGAVVSINRTSNGYTGSATYRKTVTEGTRTTTETRTMTFTFDLEPQELEAVPGGPYKVERAQTVQLDGSRSKGKNLKYEWTFAPKGCSDGLAGNKAASKQGVRPTVVLLCDTEVTLTVTDGKATDKKTVLVVVNARDWKTEFVKPQIDAYLTASRLCLPQPHFGKNVCALDGAQAFQGEQGSYHYFHKMPGEISWEGTGYELQQVDDPGGPFEGRWFVAKNHLKIRRAALISTDLNKNSELYGENKKHGYKEDVDTLIAAVTAHERMHGTLIQEALPKNDPAKKIEKMFHRDDKEALKREIDINIIQEAENALREATKDDNVKERLKKIREFNRSGQLLLQLCNTDPPKYEVLSIPSFATLGD